MKSQKGYKLTHLYIREKGKRTTEHITQEEFKSLNSV